MIIGEFSICFVIALNTQQNQIDTLRQKVLPSAIALKTFQTNKSNFQICVRLWAVSSILILWMKKGYQIEK